MQADKQYQEDSKEAEPSEKVNESHHSQTSETTQCRFLDSQNIRKASGDDSIVRSQVNNNGLPDRLKSGLESLSGYDLSSVKVHYNSPKPKQIGALAYTQGTNIHIGPGQQKHLPHEGWHAVQQMQGRVKPTMQTKGIRINNDHKLEQEADHVGKKALASSTIIKTYSKQTNAQKESIQCYMVGKNKNNNKLYNVSFKGNLICGLDYPNHELYVKDPRILEPLNRSVQAGFLEFENKGKVDFNWGSGQDISYYKVYPKYQQAKQIPSHSQLAIKNISDSLKQPESESEDDEQLVPTLEDIAIHSIHNNNETNRKLLTQWLYNFGHNESIVSLKNEYSPVYRSIHGFLDGNVTKTKALDDLKLFKMILESTIPSVFDALSTLLGELAIRIEAMIREFQNITSSSKQKRKKAYLHSQIASTKNPDDNLLLPRGCDLVTGTVLGSHEELTDPDVYSMHYAVKESTAHHFATKILTDGIDYVTIEGFAKRGYFHFDNTWEFFMHGGVRSGAKAFHAYTDIRYSFFDEFKGGEFDSTATALTGPDPGNIKANVVRYNAKQSGGIHDKVLRKKK